MTHVQIEQHAKQSDGMVGHLVWWTITEAVRKVGDLKEAGRQAGVPVWLLDRIAGRTPRGAWQAATQLGGRGKPSGLRSWEATHLRARYMTRDMAPNLRGFIREVIDGQNVAIATTLVATCSFSESQGDITFTVKNEANDLGLYQEVTKLIEGMRQTFDELNGQVDETKIAQLVRDWLSKNHRVCVRGTGGVYLVPQAIDQMKAAQILDELVAIRNWLNSKEVNSLFSVVEVRRGGATTMETFIASAVDELHSEIEDVNARLDEWRSNTKMNDGSRMFSAGEMRKRIETIRDKVATLTESLGDEVAVVNMMMETVLAKAVSMQESATSSIEQTKQAKIQSKPIKVPAPPKTPKHTKAAGMIAAIANPELVWSLPEGEPVEDVVREPVEDEGESVDLGWDLSDPELASYVQGIGQEPEEDLPSIDLSGLSVMGKAPKARKPRSDKGTKKSGITSKGKSKLV